MNNGLSGGCRGIPSEAFYPPPTRVNFAFKHRFNRVLSTNILYKVLNFKGLAKGNPLFWIGDLSPDEEYEVEKAQKEYYNGYLIDTVHHFNVDVGRS